MYTDNEDVNKAIQDFIAYRKEIKKPMTERAIKIFLRKLANMGYDPQRQIEVIENSIINNWTGIYPLKEGHNEPKRNASENRDEYAERFEGMFG